VGARFAGLRSHGAVDLKAAGRNPESQADLPAVPLSLLAVTLDDASVIGNKGARRETGGSAGAGRDADNECDTQGSGQSARS